MFPLRALEVLRAGPMLRASKYTRPRRTLLNLPTRGRRAPAATVLTAGVKIKQINQTTVFPRKRHLGTKEDRQSWQNELLFHCSADPHRFPRSEVVLTGGKDRSGKTGPVSQQQQPAAPEQHRTSNRCRTPRGAGWAFRTRNKNLEEMKLY